MKKNDLTHGDLKKQILLLAMPLAFSGILQQLFNAADVAVVGQFVGKQAMAAVGANSPVINILITLFMGLSLGANVVISRFTGKKDRAQVERSVHTAILVALISGVIVMAFGETFARMILEAMSVPADVLSMAVLYLRVYLIGMPVILLYNFESAIFQSQGDTRTPLYALIASGIINVFLNLFFVIIVGMTVDGVATATVISNVISSLVLFICLCKGKLPVTISRSQFHIDRHLFAEMVRIGLPAGIQGMVFSISNIIIQSGINSLGTDVVAGSSASANLEIIGYYLVDSFAQACTTFVGQNYGAGDVQRCRDSLKWSLIESIVIGGSISMLIVVVGKPLLRIFNQDPTVINYGMMRLVGILPYETLNGAIDVISGAMRGYGESMKPAVVTLVGVCGVRITWIYTYFQSHRTFDVLLRAYPISWVVTLAIMVVMYVVLRRNGLGEQRP
ncbi:MAG: MATE family efflux transporter [Lactimicrobium sp.]|jgi:putative MATE family efflux protein|uniref:MATE family efflux transporter n=1 Tax=Lactimicrobium sp. TaxID=2563780 RepID=UPI002F35702D